jgi:hypothetical protein
LENSGAYQERVRRTGRQFNGVARFGERGRVVQGAQEHRAGAMKQRTRLGRTIPKGELIQTLDGLREVFLERMPGTWKNRQVVWTIEPEQVINPAKCEQGPNPEPFATRAGLAPQGTCGIGLSPINLTKRQPSPGARCENFVGPLGSLMKQDRQIRVGLRRAAQSKREQGTGESCRHVPGIRGQQRVVLGPGTIDGT